MLNNEMAGGAQKSALIFAALGDPTRLQLVEKLGDGRPKSINTLSSDFKLTRQAITKHLHVLEEVGIVRSERLGRENRFTMKDGAIKTARDYLDQIGKQWDDALTRLKLHVEE
ncbi:MAG: helix-turn-helix transcriptional regulator [Alphaproteobacteria bacterium]|nr:helix-turn-helix transcriptional regulator [Alphaproteobacteria bacterium]HPF45643.1 metalloregulator ArsR/SmtB family transcription factor [Emcibacteraceae bacterium]HRW28615.1 metalloregulator ArsR/SmtB family transcription factor [Emcibacteraceae bacterium]